jgi:hypothetical protein
MKVSQGIHFEPDEHMSFPIFSMVLSTTSTSTVSPSNGRTFLRRNSCAIESPSSATLCSPLAAWQAKKASSSPSSRGGVSALQKVSIVNQGTKPLTSAPAPPNSPLSLISLSRILIPSFKAPVKPLY